MLEFESGRGFDDLARALEGVEERLLDAADEAIQEAATDAVDLARAAVPVDTGDLLGSIESNRGGWGEAFIWAGGPSAPHVRPVEARTGFFNHAGDEVEADLRARIVNRLSGVL